MNAQAWHADFAAGLLDPARPPPRGIASPDPQRRYAVHRNNVAASLLTALEDAFPVVRALVGALFFRMLALDYARALPPRSPMLRLFGERLPGFVETYAPAASLPFLADVARLESLRWQAFHAADAESLPAAAFAVVAADPQAFAASRARLHPGCRWLRSAFAVRSLWQAHQRADAIDDVRLDTIDATRSEDALIVRPALQVRVLAPPAGGIALLEALHAGGTVSEAMATALATDGSDLQALMSVLVAPGVLAALHPPSQESRP